MSIFETKLARFREAQVRKRRTPMSKSYRKDVKKKLKEAIDAATDPMVIAELSRQLAKYLPKPKQPRRRRETKPPINKKEAPEITIDELVAVIEKARREKSIKLGRGLTEAEKTTITQEIQSEGESNV